MNNYLSQKYSGKSVIAIPPWREKQSPTMRKTTCLFNFLLFTFLWHSTTLAQVSIEIKSGATLSVIGKTEIVLDGNWLNNGTFEPDSGKVTFIGAFNQTITNPNGENFHNLTVNKSGGEVQMIGSAAIAAILSLLSGDIDLNGFNITMGINALLSETPGNTVKGATGFIQTTRDIDMPTNNNVAGLGYEITSTINLGSTEIKRGHGVQSANSNNSILRFFDVTPTTNSGLNASIVFHYDESELNSATEAGLQLYRSADGGTTWLVRGGTAVPANNEVSLASVDALSRWTLSSDQLNDIVCTLEAATDTNQVGTDHTVTVTVKQSGVGQQGVAVAFEVFKGPNIGTIGDGTSPTDGSGQATFTYTSNGTPGTDSIKVSGTFNSVAFECLAEKVWVNNTCALTPASDQNQIGTDHTVTATVTQNGAAVQGVGVSFEIFKGPNQNPPTDPLLTDVDGKVTFTYTSNGTVGTDSIKAFGTVNGVDFECLAEKKWVEAVNINGKISAQTQFVFWNFMEKQFSFDLKLTNISTDTLCAPFFVEIDTIFTDPPTMPSSATVANADGGGTGIGAFFDYSDSLGGDNRLDPGEMTKFKLWVFNDPDSINFFFLANVFGIVKPGPLSPAAKTTGNEPLRFYVDVKNSRLEQLTGTTDVEEPVPLEIPTEYALHQNYPNPFNPETTIRFELTQAENVTLNIYNLHGQLVRRLVNENREAGFHEIVWDARDNEGKSSPSGVYLYRIQAGAFMEVKKLMLLR